MELLQRIEQKDVKVAIIGLGYVGLPLAIEFAKAGFNVLGVDTDRKRLNSVKKGISYIEDVPSKILYKLIKKRRIIFTSEYTCLKKMDVIIICVPTPMRKTKVPDISYILSATKHIARYMNPVRGKTSNGADGSQLIILESTTYPGTTEELILPILSRNDKKVGKDFFLAYSPERVDPGNKKYVTANIPKVVSGITPSCLSLINSLYSRVFSRVEPVTSTNVAETIKLLENTFRTVNIALVNEMAIMCHKMGIDIWEVIKGASTKPFGFMPFYPGPGVGGACLPKDPLYLAWRAKHYDYSSRFIEVASDITTSMPWYVVDRIKELVKIRKNKSLKNICVLILGIAYKKDIGDTRDSPSLEIIKILRRAGADVVYNDPYVPSIVINGKKYYSVSISNQLLRNVDIAVIITAHTKYNLSRIIKYASLVFDTRGVTWDIAKERTNVVRL